MLETIIAGSIRAPDRLYKAGIIDKECCDHPQCQGDRATTKHIMWHCHYYDHIRDPLIKHLTKTIKSLTQFILWKPSYTPDPPTNNTPPYTPIKGQLITQLTTTSHEPISTVVVNGTPL